MRHLVRMESFGWMKTSAPTKKAAIPIESGSGDLQEGQGGVSRLPLSYAGINRFRF